MINKRVTNYKELRAAVDDINESRLKQEEVIKQNVQEIKDALNPLMLAKNYLKHIAEDKELHRSALKAALAVGSQYVIEKLWQLLLNL